MTVVYAYRCPPGKHQSCKRHLFENLWRRVQHPTCRQTDFIRKPPHLRAHKTASPATARGQLKLARRIAGGPLAPIPPAPGWWWAQRLGSATWSKCHTTSSARARRWLSPLEPRGAALSKRVSLCPERWVAVEVGMVAARWRSLRLGPWTPPPGPAFATPRPSPKRPGGAKRTNPGGQRCDHAGHAATGPLYHPSQGGRGEVTHGSTCGPCGHGDDRSAQALKVDREGAPG